MNALYLLTGVVGVFAIPFMPPIGFALAMFGGYKLIMGND